MEEPQHFFIKIYTSFLFFRKGLNLRCLVRLTYGGKQRETAISTHKLFFSWTYLVVIFKTPFSTSSSSQPGNFLWVAVPTATESWDDLDPHWLQMSPFSLGHLHISFHNAHDFRSTTWLLPLIYSVTSCSRKILIDRSVNDQYAAVSILQDLV